MSSTAAPRHPPATYSSASARTHPYAAGPSSHHRAAHHRRPSPSAREDERFPPSPPRSHHDASSPPLQKATVDASDNYWDDVVSSSTPHALRQRTSTNPQPPAPASLKSILDSFRRSGEGDRDLLMAILQAKKSEEERLTAIIQTRLTILQARLNMAAIQAQMPPSPADCPPFPAQAAPVRQERTPSLSGTSSSAASPPAPHHAHPQYYQSFQQGPERIHLPPPMGLYNDRLPPLREHSREREREPRERDSRDRRESRESRDERDHRDRRERQPPSPRESAGGLEMLLEGVREAERKERV